MLFLSFLHNPQKMSFFHETVCEHIECGDIHVDNFFPISLIFKIYLVKGAYAPGSKVYFRSSDLFKKTLQL
jgi:hypothetical protein